MADTYGLDSGGNVVIQKPASTGNGPATRLTGGGGGSFSTPAPGGNFGAIADTNMKTLDAINKLTQGLLKPLIEAEQKKQYFNGMAQVAQGKTLLEVEKDQPWYTQIFGPSASVQGAQAMTLMGALNTAENDFYQALPELEQKSPDEARAWLVQQATQLSSTGDSTMDAMVQAKLAEQMGPMMGQHLKHHLKYIQDRNNVAYGNNLVTSGDVLQRKAEQSAYLPPEQMDLETQRALEAFTPMPGMTDSAWQANTVKSLRANMMKGNFAIYEAFKGTDQYQQLPQDVRTQLETQTEPYAAQWVQKNMPSYLDDAYNTVALSSALMQGGGPPTLSTLDSWMEQRNADFKVKSGGSQPLYDNAEKARMHARWYQGQKYLERQQATARAAGDKAVEQYQDDIAQRTAVGHLLETGRLPPNNSAIEPTNVQMELRSRWASLVQDQDQTGLVNHIKKLAVASNQGSKWVDQDLSMQMTTAANNFLQQGMPVSAPMKQQLQYMVQMASAPNGTAGLSNYVGAENAAKMIAMVKSGVNLDDPSAVDVVRKSVMDGWGASTTAKDRSRVMDFLNDQDTFWQKYLPLFGAGAITGYDLNDASKAHMASLLAPTAARLVNGNGLSMDEAIPLSFSLLFGNSSKIDYVDGTFTEPAPASSFKSMFSVVAGQRDISNQASEDYQQALRNTIDKSMGQDVNKLPVKEKKTLTHADKAGNAIARTLNNLVDAVPGQEGTRLFDSSTPFGTTGEFDAGNYVTAAAQTVGSGVLQVTRIPREASPSMRPITVTITADQVVAELDNVIKTGVAKRKADQARSDEWTKTMMDRTIQ